MQYQDLLFCDNFSQRCTRLFWNNMNQWWEKCCLLVRKTSNRKFHQSFVTNMVFQHVGLSWIIQSNQKLNFYFQHHCTSWIINVPLYNTTICSQLLGFLFGYCVTEFRRERYNIINSIEYNKRENKYVNDD